MTVAVTGASGHIGANLVRMLIERGARVRALVFEQTAAFENLDIERLHGNVLEVDSLKQLFDGVDVVYHLAGVITLRTRRDPWAHRVNVHGTRNVIDACRACGVRRLVHFSSIHAFSAFPEDEPVDESRTLCNERAVAYDRSKADGERAVMEGVNDGLDAIIVNPTGVLGPHDYHESAMGRVLRDLYSGRMPFVINGGFNWVDVRDVCAGAMAAAEKARAGEKYLLAGHYHTIGDVARMVAEAGGAKRKPLAIPYALAHAAAPIAETISLALNMSPRWTRASLEALRRHQDVVWSKAERELGYVARPVAASVADSLEWYAENGYVRRNGTN